MKELGGQPPEAPEIFGLPRLPLLSGYVDHYANVQPTTVALFSDESSLTYAQLPGLIDVWARAMRCAGIEKGDAVAVLAHSRPECFVAFLAAASIGALYLGLNPKYTVRELGYVVGDARPKLIFGLHSATEQELDHKLVWLAKELDYAPAIITRDHALPAVSTLLADFLAANTRTASDATSVSPTDPCSIVYTSGSTGAPKGALLTQKGMIRSASVSWETWYGHLMPLRSISQHPINHVGWLVCECISALVAGGTNYFRERFSGPETLRAIEQHRLNLWIALPSMIMLAAESPEFNTADLSSLRRVALGSLPSGEMMRRLRTRTSAVFSVSYGLTEASGGAVTCTPDHADLEAVVDTIGIAVPGVELRVVADGGRTLGPGETGELLVRDDCVFVGYLGRPDVTARTIDADGWLHTGDAVVFDNDGTYRLVGRLKEMFKSGGYNVYPTEIETILGLHSQVSAVCVVDAKDRLWGEVGVAFVVPKPGESPNESALLDYARSQLANYKVPKLFVIRRELPLLPNGKFDKLRLREEAGQLHSDR